MTEKKNTTILGKFSKLIKKEESATSLLPENFETSQWSSDEPNSDKGYPSSYEQQVKAKSQADLIRKREFTALREIRKQMASGVIPTKHKVNLQTSVGDAPRHFNRANSSSTLKKINDIEAQMSLQWCKTVVLPRPLKT